MLQNCEPRLGRCARAGLFLMLIAVATSCRTSEPEAESVYNAAMVDFVASAVFPVDHEGAKAAIQVEHFVSTWLVERCPGHQVIDPTGARPDQALWPDFEDIEDNGLALGQPHPAIIAVSEGQLDPAAFNLDNDFLTMTEEKVRALDEAMSVCPRILFPELGAAMIATAGWYDRVVYPLVDVQNDAVESAIACLRRARLFAEDGHMDSLPSFFAALDDQLTRFSDEAFAEDVDSLDRAASLAYTLCARDYFEGWLHPRLVAERPSFQTSNLAALHDLAAALEARGFTLSS